MTGPGEVFLHLFLLVASILHFSVSAWIDGNPTRPFTISQVTWARLLNHHRLQGEDTASCLCCYKQGSAPETVLVLPHILPHPRLNASQA